jgi:hypothetical protein
MSLLTITKVSGILFILDSNTTNPKAYFGGTGKYQFSSDDTTFQIFIGTDVYTNTWQNLRVGTSTPTSVSQAKTLLNSIFGT